MALAEVGGTYVHAHVSPDRIVYLLVLLGGKIVIGSWYSPNANLPPLRLGTRFHRSAISMVASQVRVPTGPLCVFEKALCCSIGFFHSCESARSLGQAEALRSDVEDAESHPPLQAAIIG